MKHDITGMEFVFVDREVADRNDLYTTLLFVSMQHNGARRMPSCTNCGEFVTPSFVRVFGDNENRVDGCPTCLTATEIYDGETLVFVPSTYE